MKKSIRSSKTLINLLKIIALGLFMVSCDKHIPENNVPDMKLEKLPIVIRDWQILGPFYDFAHIDNSTFDHMKAFWNIPEKNVTGDQFVEMNTETTIYNKVIKNEIIGTINTQYSSKKDYIDLMKINPRFFNERPKSCYLACNIKSAVTQDVVFYLRMIEKRKVWVNQQFISNSQEINKEPGSQNFFIVHLNKGDNFVLIKDIIIKHILTRFFHLSIYSLDKGKEFFFDNQVHSNFLRKVNFEIGDTLKVNKDLFSGFVSPKYVIAKVFDSKKHLLFRKYLRTTESAIVLPQLARGVYLCQLVIDQDSTYLENFIVGDYKEVFVNLQNRLMSRLYISTVSELKTGTNIRCTEK